MTNFDLRADRGLIRSTGGSVRYVLAGIEAPAAAPSTDRLPVNLAFVLDRSGSMSGEKIELAREGVLTGIRSLRESDRFAVVVFDSEVEVVVPSTLATPAARREAEQLVRGIEPRNMTDLSGGWLSGCEQVAAALADEAIGRCLLLTDGQANQGITDRDELVRHARELAARGVATTTFGVGRGFDEVLLEAMASAGGGNFYYIENGAQIADFLASEVGEALEVVAREVRLEVEAPEGVLVRSLNDLATSREGSRQRFAIGALVSEQLFDAVLQVQFAAGSEGQSVRLRVALADRDGALAGEVRELRFTYAGQGENDRQVRDHEVDREVARLFAARARAAALRRNRRGDFDGARLVLVETAVHIRAYAAADPEMLLWAFELEQAQDEYSRGMDARRMKEHHSIASSMVHNRTYDGRAKRKPDDPSRG
jgi:Ca-activated chloride channel family protein